MGAVVVQDHRDLKLEGHFLFRLFLTHVGGKFPFGRRRRPARRGSPSEVHHSSEVVFPSKEGTSREGAAHLANRTMWSCGADMTMSVPTGRSEKRIARAVAVEICLQDEPMFKERASTENVSAHGVRVLMNRKLQPGQRVLVISPQDDVRSQARIVYCQCLAERKFAVGLELPVRVDWAKP
jgi:hypothetical protein